MTYGASHSEDGWTTGLTRVAEQLPAVITLFVAPTRTRRRPE
jgi:hypothetical protein